MVWPRPTVLVEADVSGASSIGAGYLRGSIDPTRGLINVAVGHRAGTLSPETIREHSVALTDDDTRLLLPALASADQAGSMTPEVWDRLGGVLLAVERAGTLGLVLVGGGPPVPGKRGGQGGGLPVVATVAYDEPSAQVLSHGSPRNRRFDTSPLVRSLRSAAAAIGHGATDRDAHLVPPVTDAEEVPASSRSRSARGDWLPLRLCNEHLWEQAEQCE